MIRRLALALVLVGLGGCSWLCGDVVPKETVRSIKANTDDILPQYVAYVEADEGIQAITKKTRLGSAKATSDLIAKAVE